MSRGADGMGYGMGYEVEDDGTDEFFFFDAKAAEEDCTSNKRLSRSSGHGGEEDLTKGGGLSHSAHGGGLSLSRHSSHYSELEQDDEETAATADPEEEHPDDSFGDDDNSDDYPFSVGNVTCWKAVRSPHDFLTLTWGWLRHNKSQILSGLTVALAQIPEAVSFSFVAGVDPIVGLQSAWIMGLTTSLVGGRPGMIAGSTGAIAIVLVRLVEEQGLGHMFYAIMLAGILQIIFGLLRLGAVMRMVPHSVMVGFVNGLGLVIGIAQFNIFRESPVEDEDNERVRAVRRRLSEVGGAFAPFTNDHPWVEKEMLLWMVFLIVVTIATYILFPKYVTKAIPGSLAGIVVSTILEWALIRPLGYETNTVEDLASVAGSFPVPVWVDTKYDYRSQLPPFNGQLIGEIFPTAVTAAVIGLLESLLTLQIIDELTNTKGSPNREAFGQGLGNFLSGMLGGMGGCTTIGQSLMNIHSGGFTRLSSSVAALFMLLIILVAYPLINLIPVASLAGVMFLVTYFTIEWQSGIILLGSIMPQRYREQWGIHTKVKRSDVLIMLAVVGITLTLDLAVAVGCGVVLACLVFAWDAGARSMVERAVSADGCVVTYTVSGAIFFGSVKPLMEAFPSPKSDPSEAVVVLENAEIFDWSGMVFIRTLHDRFERNGTAVHFKNLNVASHKLMAKAKNLWEEVNIYQEETEEIEEEAQDERLIAIHADNPYHAHF